MFLIKSDEPTDDSSLEFRKCWALGEAYYYLTRQELYLVKNEIIKKANTLPKNKLTTTQIEAIETKNEYCKFYKSRIEMIGSICESLEINVKIDPVLNDIRKKINEEVFPDFIKDFDFESLEYLLIGKLAGKEPRYEDIFRTAKHCQGLYRQTDDSKGRTERYNFLNDLDFLRNFVSNDKRTLIRSVVSEDEWFDIINRYTACKEVEDKLYRKIHKSPLEELKPPAKVDIVNKIAGLILGSVSISDILNRWDRVGWVLLVYGGFFAAAIFIILIFFFLYPQLTTSITTPGNITKVNMTAIGEAATNITAILTLIATIIPALGSFIIIWKKYANYIELSLATHRVKHPVCGWTTYFPLIEPGIEPNQLKKTKTTDI